MCGSFVKKGRKRYRQTCLQKEGRERGRGRARERKRGGGGGKRKYRDRRTERSGRNKEGGEREK